MACEPTALEICGEVLFSPGQQDVVKDLGHMRLIAGFLPEIEEHGQERLEGQGKSVKGSEKAVKVKERQRKVQGKAVNRVGNPGLRDVVEPEAGLVPAIV